MHSRHIDEARATNARLSLSPACGETGRTAADARASKPRAAATLHRPRGWLAVGLLMILLPGCSVLAPVPDTTRYYTLVPSADAAATARGEPGARRVGVRVNVQTDYLRRAPIAVRVAANEVRFAESHRWAENVDEAVERTLTVALQSRLSQCTVVPVTHGSAAGAAEIIDVVIAACEGTVEGTAVFESYWKINAGTGAAPAASGHFRQTRAGWDGADYGQLAGLLGMLVDELAAEIAPAVDQ